MPLRVIFLGTPEFAVPTLNELIACPDTDVVGVLCQPDRPAGRGNKMHVPPVKEVATKHSIPVLQPVKLAKDPEVVAKMRDLDPDLIVMVAFGQILKKEVLDLPRHGVMNLHGSLLPKLRGAAPINWSILNGDTVTGITTMFSDPGVDTGPMLLKAEVPLTDDMTSVELAQELSTVGAKLVIETIKKLIDGSLVSQVQDDSQHTYAPMLTKDMAVIDWRWDARTIHNRVRGLQPWPGTVATCKGSQVKIWKTKLHAEKQAASKPGTLFLDANQLLVACGESGDERLELIEMQPANKNRMQAQAWANGIHLKSGQEFFD
jgi:methionyl-tRNA formyltransferase